MANDNKDDIIIAMLEEIKSSSKNQKSTQIHLTKVDSLVERMERNISATTELNQTILRVCQPVVSERKFTIDLVAKESLFLFIGMMVIISGLSVWLYLATRSNYDRIDNDLKCHYFKPFLNTSLNSKISLKSIETTPKSYR